ncbi:hypothetical protein Hypma_013122 [Hypsizygus marmoreus]|uniref:Uncharacterized protein n=1 Tax=Hypsizygus marmoreus TaxID=39966 RepID=A0A369JFU2_HYPMA|nr:hypothetical protein Hypma_013122 [Hypsizygus marmoreus]
MPSNLYSQAVSEDEDDETSDQVDELDETPKIAFLTEPASSPRAPTPRRVGLQGKYRRRRAQIRYLYFSCQWPRSHIAQMLATSQATIQRAVDEKEQSAAAQKEDGDFIDGAFKKVMKRFQYKKKSPKRKKAAAKKTATGSGDATHPSTPRTPNAPKPFQRIHKSSRTRTPKTPMAKFPFRSPSASSHETPKRTPPRLPTVPRSPSQASTPQSSPEIPILNSFRLSPTQGHQTLRTLPFLPSSAVAAPTEPSAPAQLSPEVPSPLIERPRRGGDDGPVGYGSQSRTPSASPSSDTVVASQLASTPAQGSVAARKKKRRTLKAQTPKNHRQRLTPKAQKQPSSLKRHLLMKRLELATKKASLKNTDSSRPGSRPSPFVAPQAEMETEATNTPIALEMIIMLRPVGSTQPFTVVSVNPSVVWPITAPPA